MDDNHQYPYPLQSNDNQNDGPSQEPSGQNVPSDQQAMQPNEPQQLNVPSQEPDTHAPEQNPPYDTVQLQDTPTDFGNDQQTPPQESPYALQSTQYVAGQDSTGQFDQQPSVGVDGQPYQQPDTPGFQLQPPDVTQFSSAENLQSSPDASQQQPAVDAADNTAPEPPPQQPPVEYGENAQLGMPQVDQGAQQPPQPQYDQNAAMAQQQPQQPLPETQQPQDIPAADTQTAPPEPQQPAGTSMQSGEQQPFPAQPAVDAQQQPAPEQQPPPPSDQSPQPNTGPVEAPPEAAPQPQQPIEQPPPEHASAPPNQAPLQDTAPQQPPEPAPQPIPPEQQPQHATDAQQHQPPPAFEQPQPPQPDVSQPPAESDQQYAAPAPDTRPPEPPPDTNDQPQQPESGLYGHTQIQPPSPEENPLQQFQQPGTPQPAPQQNSQQQGPPPQQTDQPEAGAQSAEPGTETAPEADGTTFQLPQTVQSSGGETVATTAATSEAPPEQESTDTGQNTGWKYAVRSKITSAGNRAKKIRFKSAVSAAAFGILIFGIFNAQVILGQVQYLTTPSGGIQAPSGSVNPDAPIGDEPSIIIPQIDVNVPVVYDEPSFAEEKVQKALERGVVHYGTTAKPGENGNVVIVGHSSNNWWDSGKYKFAFILLDKLQQNDEIVLHYQGTRYVYQVETKKVVEPTNTSVLNQTEEPRLTLITCTPPGTSWQRLIVQARQVTPDPSQNTNPEDASSRQSQSLPSDSSRSFFEFMGDLF